MALFVAGDCGVLVVEREARSEGCRGATTLGGRHDPTVVELHERGAASDPRGLLSRGVA
jgi:hypothetical protein